MSGPIDGPISDRLRAQADPNDPAWHPGRPAQPTTPFAIPAGVSGYQLGASSMGDARGMHYAAAEQAVGAVAGVQESISMGTERCEEALGIIRNAIGDSPVESAQQALRFVAGARELLEEAFRASQAAVEELERYQRGF